MKNTIALVLSLAIYGAPALAQTGNEAPVPSPVVPQQTKPETAPKPTPDEGKANAEDVKKADAKPAPTPGEVK